MSPSNPVQYNPAERFPSASIIKLVILVSLYQLAEQTPGLFNRRITLTLDNFGLAWNAAPFARYFVNTILLVTLILAAQLVLCTLAAYAFARYEFPGRDIAFATESEDMVRVP